MKQIKYRIWDEENDKFVPAFEAFRDVCGWQNDETGSRIILREDKYKLTQFIGELDKNGREIYEGDILHVESFTGAWEDHTAVVPEMGIDGAWPSSWQGNVGLSEVEVIGNRFENCL